MGRTACTEPQSLYRGALYLFFTHSVGGGAGKHMTGYCPTALNLKNHEIFTAVDR